MQFKPEKIPHVKGQDKKIESREKAHDMAVEYNPFHSIAQAYESFLHLDATGSEQRGSEFFKEMKKAGVSPDYVRTVGDLVAESTGAMHDYREEVVDKSIEELEADARSAEKELLLYEHHPNYSATKLSVSPESPRGGMSIQEPTVTQRKAILETDMVEQQRIKRLIQKFVVSNTELGRRRKYI